MSKKLTADVYTVRTTSDQISKREKANGLLASEAAAEGTVLLENNGLLPLKKGSRAALWGCGSVFTVKGGTGSGEVNNRVTDKTMYYHGLSECYTLTNPSYLGEYLKVRQQIQDGTIDANDPHVHASRGFFGIVYDGAEVPITDQALMESDPSDTAFFVVSRISGEGYDRQAKEGDGDYFLSDIERANLEKVTDYYQHVVVLLNMASVMDTNFIRQINARKHGVIGAVVLSGQGGEFSGEALANVLTGTVTPSGHLTDTWPFDFKDIPSSATLDRTYDPAYPEGNYDEYYFDDIYVGYRYFDTFNVAPAYEFGYGLSYTTFAIKTNSVKADAETVSVDVTVTNTGKTYAGKQVVQVYYSAPDGALEKPYQELAAYAKTDTLEPGQSQQLTISFRTASMASYSEDKAAYILEKGDYIIRVGASSRSTHIAAVIRLDGDALTEQLSNQMQVIGQGKAAFGAPPSTATGSKKDVLEAGKIRKTADTVSYSYTGQEEELAAAPVLALTATSIPSVNHASKAEDEAVTTYVSANDPETDSAKYAARGGWKARAYNPFGAWAAALGLASAAGQEVDKAPETIKKVETVKGATLLDVYDGRISMEQFVAGLSVEELTYLVNGVDADRMYGTGYARRNQVSEMTAKDGTKLGKSYGFLANYTPGTVWASTGRYFNTRLIPSINLPDGPAGPRISRTGKTTLYTVEKPLKMKEDGSAVEQEAVIDASEKTYYQFSTAWPVGCMLAQTWNQDLLKKVGKAYGQELREFGCTLLLGPGMNIHRPPLCGRNFEYYSEDPVVAGLTASSYILGAQSNDGVGFTMKHFACNNNENGRMFVNDVVSERAIREIYLKGFEIAFKSAQPMALMTSYNGINEVWAVNNYDLITDICKNEWGFKGVVMSDYGAANQAQSNLALSLNKWANIMHAGNDWIMGGSYETVEKTTDDFGSDHDESFYHLLLKGDRPAMPLGDLQKCAIRILNILMVSNKFGDDMVNWLDTSMVKPQDILELLNIHNGPYNDRVKDDLINFVTVEKH